MNRRNFLKKGALFLPASFIFPAIIKAQSVYKSGKIYENGNVFSGLGTVGGGGGGGNTLNGNLLNNETFETASTGYVLTGWNSDVNGTLTPASNTVVLDGTQSCRMQSVANTGCGTHNSNFSTTADAWGWFLWYATSLTGSVVPILYLKDGSNNGLLTIAATIGGNFNVKDSSTNNNTDFVMTISAATKYWVWYHYNTNGSNTSTCSMSAATTNVRPPFVNAGGTSTANCALLEAGNQHGDNFDMYYDDINLANNGTGF